MFPNVEYIKTLVNGLREFINTKIKSVKKDMDALPRVQYTSQSLADSQKAQARENICSEDVVEISTGYGYTGFINSAGYGANDIYKARIGETYFKNVRCNNPGNMHPEYILGAHTITLNFNANSMDVTPSDISSSEIEFFKQEARVTKIPSKYVPTDAIFVSFYKNFTDGTVHCEKTHDELQSLIEENRHIVVLEHGGTEFYWLEGNNSSGGFRFICPNGRAVTIGSDGNNIWDFSHFATESYVDSKEPIINSSTEGSTKKFKITVDDTGTITATEVTESTT